MTKKPTYKELEKQLKDLKEGREEIFKQLLKKSFDMIVLLNSNGNQHYVSESSKNILGFRPEELTNIPVIEKMIHPDDREKTMLAFRDILENSANGGTQYRHLHKNGSWVYLEAFGTNQIDNPLIKSVILNVRDITERKKTEQLLKANETRLKELNAIKDRIFSIIAHDLKSPFNSIYGFSNLLTGKIEKKDFDGLEKYATIIQNSSKKAVDLLTSLIEWSRSQTGRNKFNPEYVELGSIINEVTDLFKDSASQKSITIFKDLPLKIPVIADKAMIGCVLRNLLSNAIKFTHAGGEISIGANQQETEIQVSIADNGVGMKKEAINNLFQIEKSYSTLGTQQEVGTGLGLLLCKEFIEMHNGKIWVVSELGNGSVFNFTVPFK
ncbi:MAG: PAS domain-containing sensor histidine kinase [Bacteroidales bacterium]|nr:PAS domain-containing sensor histidine kinase [Bacteroidales bacterium]